jgi:hypothetical protein
MVSNERLSRYRDYLRLVAGAVVRPRIFPRGDIPATTWGEVTDPADFVVQSLLLLYYSREESEVWGDLTPAIWVMRRVYVLIGVIGVAGSLVVPIIVSPGNPVAFGITLLGFGFLTLIPGQVAATRKRLHIKEGREYPEPLRKAMWVLELLALVVAIVLLARSNPDATHQGILWGLFTVSLSELATFYALVSSSLSGNVFNADGPLQTAARRIADHERIERQREQKPQVEPEHREEG